jgi:glycosyltransferase involved in cell wall biosynthesis
MEMHVAVLAKELSKRGHQLTVLSARNSRLFAELERQHINTHDFSPKAYFDVFSTIKLVELLKRSSFDVIHTHYSKDLWSIITARKFSKAIPVVFIKHIGTQKPKRDQLHRFIYKNIAHTIAVSQVIKNNLLNTHPIDASRVSVVHHGIDMDYYRRSHRDREKIRSEFNIGDDDILIGTIGRLQEGKGHLEFLEMAGVIGKRYPASRFVIVGEPTHGEEDKAEIIHKKAKETALGERLIFTGFRTDIPALLSAMDIFAFPSRAEAFGLVLIEAMSAGLPVIANRSDGILDIIDDGVNGLLIEPMNIDLWIERVESLIRHPQLRSRLATSAIETVRSKFTSQRMVDQVESIYHHCLSSQG